MKIFIQNTREGQPPPHSYILAQDPVNSQATMRDLEALTGLKGVRWLVSLHHAALLPPAP